MDLLILPEAGDLGDTGDDVGDVGDVGDGLHLSRSSGDGDRSWRCRCSRHARWMLRE